MKFIKRLKPVKSVSLKKRQSLAGYFFVMPFVIGFLLFFLVPFVQSIIFSLNKLKLVPSGYELEFVKWANYKFAIFTHAKFVRIFTETFGKMLADVPLIILFSLFSALLLNQKFKGRLIVRTIFFLPVILGSGIILAMERGDYITELLQVAGSSSNGFMSGSLLKSFLMQMKLPLNGVKYILAVVEDIPVVIRASGIQILIFLAGLQSIPYTLYEASRVEGATKWENFWLITVPMISPIILTNIVYTIIDSFLSSSNKLVILIKKTAFGGAGFGVSSAMGVMYFAAIGLILAIVVGIISRWVFYYE